VWVQQLFSIVHTNFRAWINTSDLEEKEVKHDDVSRGIIVTGTLLVCVCVCVCACVCHWSHNGDEMHVVSEVPAGAEGRWGY
jgi:hypothetical protein